MPDTPWQREEDKRFLNNSEIVRKIADLFGLQILGFNPDWHFEQKYKYSSSSSDSSYGISDDFMSKAAVAMGYKWDFNKDIYKEIQMQEELVKQLRLRLEDQNNQSKLILEMAEKHQITVTDDIIQSLETNYKFDEKSLSEAEELLNNLKKVVEIRDNLKRLTNDINTIIDRKS